jgi:hypothetical protein
LGGLQHIPLDAASPRGRLAAMRFAQSKRG